MQQPRFARFAFDCRLNVAVCVLLALAGTMGRGSDAGAQEPAGKDARPTNRLSKETSPYLLLHAHNPVDWYPWGPEAFARAKAENKPVFLSIGYSSCYWCHVMERESFSDAEIARFLNEHFVCIKVDREERPDVDQIYMAALQAFSTGGWPMSMFLLPDGRPFYGETYLPPRDHQGFAGLLSVLKGIVKSWREERAEIDRSAAGLTEIVRRKLASPANRKKPELSPALAASGREALAEQFDPEFGGFGFSAANPRRPKFPEPANLVFLLDQERRDAARSGASKPSTSRPARNDPLFMALFTLDRMARGGIRDQLAGGYHRYATSRYWIVPHFEKMLYDNAQLASVHLMAFERTGDLRWRREAEATFAFVARTMTAPQGGFYSSLDAESADGEGAYYVWTREEVKDALGSGPEAEAFLQVYGLKREPNFEHGRYVLLQPRPLAEQAGKLQTTPARLEEQLAPLRARLLAARASRQAPRCDDKIITAWNGLMIAAYADGYRVLKNEQYRRAAENCAGFLLEKLREPGGRLLRTYRAGSARLPAYLEDYAFLVHGLLRLHAATGQSRWLDEARTLADRMVADFFDTRQGGFFFTAGDHESLLARPKDLYDGALPSGNSAAVLDLVALARATREPRYLEPARRTLEALGSAMQQNPAAMPLLLVGLQDYLDARGSAVVPRPDGGGSEPAARAGPSHVKATARWLDTRSPSTSGLLRAVVSLEIEPGWHIYANPAGDPLMKPTSLTLNEGTSAAKLTVEYPPGKTGPGGTPDARPPLVYEGKVELPIRLSLTSEGLSSNLTLRLKLGFQACDDGVCLPPASLMVPLEVSSLPQARPAESRP